jgi:hypothetical protein
MAHRQEKATTSDDSEAEQQENVTSDDDALTTEQLEQNKRRASSNDSIENEFLNPACIFFSTPRSSKSFYGTVSRCEYRLFQFPTIDP